MYNPVSALLPVIFIFCVGMLKDGYEDYLRHKTDKKTNRKLVKVIRNDSIQSIESQNIHVGDFLIIEKFAFDTYIF